MSTLTPILVAGYGRSGTTALMALLGSDPRVAFDRRHPYENRYLTYQTKFALLSARHGPQPAVYPSTTEVRYVAALRKADADALTARLEKEIDQLQDRLDQFNHARKVEVDGRILELAS